MLNKLKVFLLRWFYRLLSAWAWRAQKIGAAYGELQIPISGVSLALRLYTNDQGADKPLIVYFHGGGWVIGDLGTHHPFCQKLSSRSACSVVSVNYRLAPEHPYPAAHDDCLNATQWIAEHLAEMGPNNGKVILAGDSAGGNLATCTCLSLDKKIRTAVAGEIVLYPVTDHYSNPFPSYQDKATGYALTSKLMVWFWDTYLATSGEDYPKAATPLQANNLDTLPPTLLITAENDPLRDEGIAFANKLRENGVPLHYRHFEKDQHGFACSQGSSESVEALMDDIAGWIKNLD